MDNAKQALLNGLEQKGLPKIASFWRLFLEHGCTIYLLSDPGYGPRDAYALSWISRYFPPTADLEIVPVYGELEVVSAKNLIILGMLRSFESEELVSSVAYSVIHDRGHFRFIDNEHLLQIETGELWSRVRPDRMSRWARDFGVLRLWQQQETGRMVMNCCGLGPIGTLGTAMAFTDIRQPVIAKVEARLPLADSLQQSLVEILLRVEWKAGSNPTVVNPADVTIELESDFTGFQSVSQPNWPLMSFRKVSADGDHSGEVRYEVWVTDARSSREKRLSQNQIEFTVLAAIARRTEQEASTFVGKGGYISYREIGESQVVKKILNNYLDAPEVSQVVARLRKTLVKGDWARLFPNLLLESKAYAEARRHQIVVLRLRAKFDWGNTGLSQ